MDNVEPGPSGVKIVTRLDIFNMLKKHKERNFSDKLDAVKISILANSSFPNECKADFIPKFYCFKQEMKIRWTAANRTKSNFLKKNREWLNGTFDIPHQTVFSAGRPHMTFDNLSERSKRRKTQPLREETDANKLLFAGQMKLREEGNQSGAGVIKDIMSTPTRGNKYRTAFRNKQLSLSSATIQLTPLQALSMFVEANLTKHQYEIIRSTGKKLYPCYSVLTKAKNDCYPTQDAYRVTENCAEIRLQALVNHSVQRLCEYLNDIFDKFSPKELKSLEMIYKWGCDGSQQSQFKQKFVNEMDSDANIFQSSMVPLRLFCKNTSRIVWQNPTPSSPRFCRPMRIRFVHETKDITTEEINYYKRHINDLLPTEFTKGSYKILVSHNFLLTMVDGKVCNAATETASTMRCYLCKLTSKDFNNLEKCIQADATNVEFGLSTLHARIRFFETLLHLAYKLTIKKWQIRSKRDKEIVQKKKNEIQTQFKKELGLIVDFPKPGFGSSNDGNTSRRFFANPEVAAAITGIDIELIKKFSVILEVISSGLKINTQKFGEFCIETARLYVDLYPWQPMTPTVHKILVHGKVVIEQALLPIGMLSEEAAEARNKHFRLYRQNFSRKFSREHCNYDVLNRLLLTSDPLLSSMRPKPRRMSNPFSTLAIQMFLPGEIALTNLDEEDSD